MKSTTPYPRYHLAAFLNDRRYTYHTKHKKSFLMKLDGLTEIRELVSLHFSITYSPKLKNSSIVYQNENEFKQAKKDARIFTSKKEVDFIMNDIKNNPNIEDWSIKDV